MTRLTLQPARGQRWLEATLDAGFAAPAPSQRGHRGHSASRARNSRAPARPAPYRRRGRLSCRLMSENRRRKIAVRDQWCRSASAAAEQPPRHAPSSVSWHGISANRFFRRTLAIEGFVRVLQHCRGSCRLRVRRRRGDGHREDFVGLDGIGLSPPRRFCLLPFSRPFSTPPPCGRPERGAIASRCGIASSSVARSNSTANSSPP